MKNIIATLLLIIIFSLNTQKLYTTDNNTKVKSVNVPKSATNPTSTEVTLCTELSDFFNEYYNEYSIQNLQNTEQLIIVRDYKSYKRLITFEKENNIWKKDLEVAAAIGKDGISENCSEFNCCTPKGIFHLGFAFGTEKIDNLLIEYKQINENCYWIDDPESELYNQWIESADITWNSAEHLIEFPQSYKYAVSIEYNSNPIVPYAGSAFFLHCNNGYNYTAGCVSIAEKDMLYILHWLNSKKNPIILITD